MEEEVLADAPCLSIDFIDVTVVMVKSVQKFMKEDVKNSGKIKELWDILGKIIYRILPLRETGDIWDTVLICNGGMMVKAPRGNATSPDPLERGEVGFLPDIYDMIKQWLTGVAEPVFSFLSQHYITLQLGKDTSARKTYESFYSETKLIYKNIVVEKFCGMFSAICRQIPLKWES